MILLSAQNLSKTYMERHVLDDVSFFLNEGDKVGIIGINGTGKSTLLRILAGAEEADQGEVIRSSGVRISYLPQIPEFEAHGTVLEQVMAHLPQDLREAKVFEARSILGKLGIADCERDISTLSGGEKRRAAIAGVIAMQPKVLILDEPTAGLDPLGRNTILDMLSKYRREHNTTVVLVSHSMEDVAKVADKAIVMDHGKVAIYDTVEKVFSNAERLEKIGLNVPEITKIFSALRSRGIDLPDDVYTVDRALSVLLPILKKGAAK